MVDYRTGPEFAEEFKQHSLKLLMGEVVNEKTPYSTYNAPKPDKESLILQVSI